MFILNLLVRYNLLKPRPLYVHFWQSSHNITMLRLAIERGDYRVRSTIAEKLAYLEHPAQKELLLELLADRNRDVVIRVVASLNTLILSREENSWIKSRLLDLAEEEAFFINTLRDSDFIKVTGAYVDRDQMKRLKAVKAILKKFQGSKSIG